MKPLQHESNNYFEYQLTQITTLIFFNWGYCHRQEGVLQALPSDFNEEVLHGRTSFRYPNWKYFETRLGKSVNETLNLKKINTLFKLLN